MSRVTRDHNKLSAAPKELHSNDLLTPSLRVYPWAPPPPTPKYWMSLRGWAAQSDRSRHLVHRGEHFGEMQELRQPLQPEVVRVTRQVKQLVTLHVVQIEFAQVEE